MLHIPLQWETRHILPTLGIWEGIVSLLLTHFSNLVLLVGHWDLPLLNLKSSKQLYSLLLVALILDLAILRISSFLASLFKGSMMGQDGLS